MFFLVNTKTMSIRVSFDSGITKISVGKQEKCVKFSLTSYGWSTVADKFYQDAAWQIHTDKNSQVCVWDGQCEIYARCGKERIFYLRTTVSEMRIVLRWAMHIARCWELGINMELDARHCAELGIDIPE
jgi:hypothetical protein